MMALVYGIYTIHVMHELSKSSNFDRNIFSKRYWILGTFTSAGVPQQKEKKILLLSLYFNIFVFIFILGNCIRIQFRLPI